MHRSVLLLTINYRRDLLISLYVCYAKPHISLTLFHCNEATVTPEVVNFWYAALANQINGERKQ
jgi:hypothetical protein